MTGPRGRNTVAPRTLVYFYWTRLRTHPVQEVLAGLGVGIGVALVFAVQVANSSVAASAEQIGRGVTGTADVQLAARDGRGFPEGALEVVRGMPGVKRAAPILEQRAVLSRSGRHVAVNVVSVDPSLAAMSGSLVSSFAAGGLVLERGLMLPTGTAHALGLPDLTAEVVRTAPRDVRLELRGRSTPVGVAGLLGPETVGPLAEARVAVAPLRYLQEIAGLDGRITRILVDSEPGAEAQVRRLLNAFAGDRLLVTGVDVDAQLLATAVESQDEAADFFAAMGIMVGLLLAFNAMLLTAPERRRMIADLRLLSYRRTQILQIFAFQSAVLGVAATAAGLLLGAVLAKTIFQSYPDYLASVFALGTGTTVTGRALAFAAVGGLAVTFAASAPPLLDLRRRHVVDGIYRDAAEPGQSLSSRTRLRLLVAGGLLVLVTHAMLLITPSAAFIAGAGLAVAMLLAIPTIFAVVIWLGERAASRLVRLNLLVLALLSLRATTVRSLALASIGAVSVFGAVALDGARRDLLDGLYQSYGEYVAGADLWIVQRHDDLATKDWRAQDAVRRVAAIDGVSAVRPYYGAFLDVGDRRTWVVGRATGDAPMIPPSQIIDGDPATAETRMRGTGWIALSDQLAAAYDVGPGERVKIETPSGSATFRVAATTSNLGWAPGAMILNATDFREGWETRDPTALEVDIADGADLAAVQRDIEVALGAGRALLVQPSGARWEQANAVARQGSTRLQQISVLLLISAILAMAAAMATAIWQRRPSLAGLRLQSFRPRQLWLALLLESAVVLGVGCVAGAAAGAYGQVLIDQWLERSTGFPVLVGGPGWQTVAMVGVALVASMLVIAIPSYAAARAPQRLGLSEHM